MYRHRHGFTLTETLFAMFVVTIAAFIMSAALPIGHKSRHKADMKTKAAELAQRELDSLRAVGYPNIDAPTLLASGLLDSTEMAVDGYPFSNVQSASGDAVGTVLPSGEGYLQIVQLGLDTKSIIVTLRWTENGKTQEIKMGSIIGNL